MCLSIYLTWKRQKWYEDKKYFIMHGMGLLIDLDSYLAPMFYAWYQ